MANNTNDVKMLANQSLLQKTNKTQAAFVPKLYLMVEDMRQPTPEDQNPERPLISWSKTGDVFCVFDPIEFSRVILPLHFKHNNWQSFVRQLNMYGFHKVNDLLSSAQCHPDISQAWEFRHPHFKRNRPDLLPMIKRKSTKHHGTSKATTAQVKSQAPFHAGQTRFHHHMPASDDASSRTAGPFHAYMPQNHPGCALSLAHRPLHGKPPPPPPLRMSKIIALPHAPVRPPVLHPILTHQIQYPHASHQKGKTFSPPLSPANIPGPSSNTTSNTCNQSSNLSSPRSSRPSVHNFHHITHQPAQHVFHSAQEDKFTPRGFVHAWSSKPEPPRNDAALGRIEDELRRLNNLLSHRDAIGDHIFSVLGLLVQLVTLLVTNQQDQKRTDEQKTLSKYVQAAKDAMASLETFNHDPHDGARKCSGAPSTASISPVSTDPAEWLAFQSNQSRKPSVDLNSTKITSGALSPSPVVRPRFPDRQGSSQSLPPLRTIMENWTPPIPNQNRSSAPLPASINRLMNDDSHGHFATEMSSASEDNANEETLEEDYDDLNQDDYDDIALNGGDEDDLEEDADSNQARDDDSDESGHEETQGHQSADGHLSGSCQLSDTPESPSESFARQNGIGFQRGYHKDRSDLIPVKRPSVQLRGTLSPPRDTAEQRAGEDASMIHSASRRKRTKHE